MKLIFLFALLVVITFAEELKDEKVQLDKAKSLIDVLTFDTKEIVNDITREKRQYGKQYGNTACFS